MEGHEGFLGERHLWPSVPDPGSAGSRSCSPGPEIRRPDPGSPGLVRIRRPLSGRRQVFDGFGPLRCPEGLPLIRARSQSGWGQSIADVRPLFPDIPMEIPRLDPRERHTRTIEMGHPSASRPVPPRTSAGPGYLRSSGGAVPTSRRMEAWHGPGSMGRGVHPMPSRSRYCWLLSRRRVAGAGDGVAHLGIGLDVPQAVIFADADVALAERLGDRHGDLGLGRDHLGPVLLDLRDHLLLLGDGEGPPLLGLGAGHPRVGLGLEGLEVGADIVADVDVGDVDREDLVGRAGVEPFSSTRLEIVSGRSSTCSWVSAEPIALTMPSPTRAMIVSSVAPPTRRSRLVRTVTFALTLSWMPFLATPSMLCRPELGSGHGITLGLTLVCTASRTLRPARSIAAARLYDSGMSARLAAIRARTTFGTLPPAR